MDVLSLNPLCDAVLTLALSNCSDVEVILGHSKSDYLRSPPFHTSPIEADMVTC
jgi:hypothetical protein